MLTILTYILLALVVVIAAGFVYYQFIASAERKQKIDNWIITKCHWISTSMFGSAMSFDAMTSIGLDEIFWFATYGVTTVMLQLMKTIALRK